MAIAVWSPRFATGIERIDRQHQALFEAVNDLAESFHQGRSAEQVQRSLAFLEGYVAEHFADEEAYMADAGYPELTAHRELHQALTAQVHDLQERLRQNEVITLDVTIFLADWLKHHIEDADMGYVRFTREQQAD